jgi:hypothetical protein
MLPQQRQGESVEPGEILAEVLVPHPRVVLAIGDIEDPVANAIKPIPNSFPFRVLK